MAYIGRMGIGTRGAQRPGFWDASLFADFPMPSWDATSLFLNWFLLYFLMITVINSERRFFIFLLAFLLYNLKMSQHGLWSWASRGFSFTSWGLQGPPAGRA